MSAGKPHSLSQAYIDENIGYRQLGFAIATFPILAIFVGFRFWSRRLTRAPWWYDDFLVIWAYILAMAISGMEIWSVLHAGVGRHLPALEVQSPETITKYFKYVLAGSFSYFFTVPWPKLAILALYYRIFGSQGTRKVYRYIIYILTAVVSFTGIVTTVWTMNLCKPFQANWDRTLLETVPGSYCLNEQAFYIYGSVPNIVTDVVMLILPMPMVWKLNMTHKNKAALTFIFAMGSLGLVASILRFNFFVGTSAIADGTFNGVQLGIWTLVEIDVYIITACLPVYRPLFRKIFGLSISKVQSPANVQRRELDPENKDKFDSYGKMGSESDITTAPSTNSEEDGVQLMDYPSLNLSSLGGYGNIEVRHEINVQSTAA